MPVERAKVQDAYEAFGEIEALCARLWALRAGLTEREQLSIMNRTGASWITGTLFSFACLFAQDRRWQKS
jgi:hypothetical protein